MMTPKTIPDQPSSSEPRPLLMPGCERFLKCSAAGLPYEIFVSVPDVPTPPCGFPAIYVLDGNADFLAVSETLKRVSRRPKTTGIMPAVVVGIGYPDTDGYNLDRRYRDFTRGLPSDDDFNDVPAQGCGGQADYIRFLQHDLLPRINQHFPVDPSSAVLLGHSLGGYFVLELLARHPDLFAGYISFSPSVWWDRQGLMGAISTARQPSRKLQIYTAVGEREQSNSPRDFLDAGAAEYATVRLRRRMIDNAKDAAASIESRFGRNALVKFDIGLDEDHATIVPAMLCRALRFIGGISSEMNA